MVLKYGCTLTKPTAILSPAMPTRTRPRALIRTRRALDEPVSRLVGLAGQTLELECPLTSSRSVDPTSIEWRKGELGQVEGAPAR